jgi:2-amino-4-hydroxy-6-hydroxymethyldihydropteridine diphosphokinase
VRRGGGRPTTLAAVALGSNVGDRLGNLRRAVARLDPVKTSSVYETAPVGEANQPAFLNAVALVETDLGPRQMLDALLAIERACGRVRDPARRWGPRTIDLDLLVHGGAVVAEAGLTLPHPRLADRRFVLEPLAEIAPDLLIPALGPARDLLARLPPGGVERLAGPEALL